MLVALRRTLILASRYAECQAAKPGVRWAGNPLCANCITVLLFSLQEATIFMPPKG
jgi:hypothetical protein